MTKRKGLLDVKVDVRGLLEELPVSNSAASKARTEQPAILSDSILISNALDVITRQMKVSGNRSRTISDYVLHVEHFQRVTNVADITANTIYKCLDSMNVSNQTKLTRLKCLKAFFV